MYHGLVTNYVTYLILSLCILVGLVLSVVIFSISYFLALQSPNSEKTSSYECGFEPFQDARNKFVVIFYIVAILFLIFDLEVLFLFPWAVIVMSVGSSSFITIAIFLWFLTFGYIYEVEKGILDSIPFIKNLVEPV